MSEMRERGGSGGTEAPAGAEEEEDEGAEEEEEDGDGAGEDAAVMERGDESLAAAYESWPTVPCSAVTDE